MYYKKSAGIFLLQKRTVRKEVFKKGEGKKEDYRSQNKE